jgi:hypothetical protein
MKYVVLISALALTGCDKALHFAVGAGISAAVTDMTQSPALGCVAATVAGIAKEAIDFIPDPLDLAATVAGGCVAARPGMTALGLYPKP